MQQIQRIKPYRLSDSWITQGHKFSRPHMYSSSMTGSEGHDESHEQLERQNSLADAGTTTEGSNLPQVLGAMTIYHPPQ
jgi:hypothetical protein